MQMSRFTESPSQDKTIGIIGDSGAGDTGTGINECDCYPNLLVNLLNTVGGCNVVENRNAASGRGTVNSIASALQGQSLFTTLLPPTTPIPPTLAIVQLGVNDPGGLTLAATSITRSGTTATVTMSAPHPFVNGQTVTIAGAANPISVSSITRVATTATVTTGSVHGLSTGQWVGITGATGADATLYNGVFQVTVTDTTHYTYTMTGTPTGSATGTITSGDGAIYNGAFTITFVDFYSFTYTMLGTPNATATGSPTANGAVSTATTTTNLEAIILGLMGGANRGVVGYPANLPAGRTYGTFEQPQPDRCVVYSDNDSTGGISAALYTYTDPISGFTTLPTITGASTGLTVWENVYAGGSGGVASWRRIMSMTTLSGTPTLVTPGVQYVMLNGAWYLNWAGGSGDSTKTCTGITRSGTTATATVTSHGWSNGNHVNIVGASDSNLNGSYSISNVATNTFDYTVANTGATSVAACNATRMYTTYDDLSGGVRYAQKAAVTAFNTTDRVKYCDQWAYEQNLITSGKVTALSDLFSLAAGNQHRNFAGHQSQAIKLYTDILAWTTLFNILQFSA